MVVKGYENIDTWIFDLDRTLYTGPFNWEKRAFSNFFEYVETHYGIDRDKAAKMDKEFAHQSFYLKGWLEEIPHFDIHHWWDQINQVDVSDVPVCELTKEKLKELPENKVLFTNGHPSHADKFLSHLGLTNHFDEVIAIDVNDIKGNRFKPNPDIYHEIMGKMKTKPQNCVMFEDNLHNLETAHNLGMGTVLVNVEDCHKHLDYIHNQKDTFTHWLEDHIT
jgi:putative hydrolase of the HAD superfamily